MNDKKRCIISISLKSAVVLFTIIGVICSCLFGYVGGAKAFLYFTTLSNVWLGVVDLVLIIALIIALKNKKYDIHHNYYLAQLIFTTSIAITGFVYCFILAPAALFNPANTGKSYGLYIIPAIILHMIVPILAVVDFFITTRNGTFKKLDCLYSAIPPIAYFIFATIGFVCNLDFGKGENFPYFFLNHNSPAGVFGFSSEMPYFMGSFYWCLIIAFLIILFSLLFITIVNKIIIKSKEK